MYTFYSSRPKFREPKYSILAIAALRIAAAPHAHRRLRRISGTREAPSAPALSVRPLPGQRISPMSSTGQSSVRKGTSGCPIVVITLASGQ